MVYAHDFAGMSMTPVLLLSNVRTGKGMQYAVATLCTTMHYNAPPSVPINTHPYPGSVPMHHQFSMRHAPSTLSALYLTQVASMAATTH
jgi:hypothetical protein